MRQQLAHQIGLLGFILVLGYYSTSVALADIAPPAPPAGTNPEPGDTTQVRMLAEIVVMEISADDPKGEGLARVTASFVMRNLGPITETMLVRFPLDLSSRDDRICSIPSLELSPITDLQAFVNEQPAATETLSETIELFSDSPPYPTVTRPCWKQFRATFPPDEDINIRVTYSTVPDKFGSDYGYSYVLHTGAGWADTIGSADIVMRLPYTLSPENYQNCFPASCLVKENEVLWHFEDFEPDFNVSANFLPPPIWQRIVMEKERLIRNPNDGEAWGRLGKAYKEAIRESKGYRSDALGMEMYRLSDEAYQKALALLPDDADWHYGYAELLCWNAEWNQFFTTEIDGLKACLDQLQFALALDPNYIAATEYRDYLARSRPDWITIDNDLIIYLFLTPTPTITSAPSLPTDGLNPNTIVPPIASTRIAQATPSPLPEITSSLSPVPPTTKPAAEISSGFSTAIIWLGVMLIGCAVVLIILRLRGK